MRPAASAEISTLLRVTDLLVRWEKCTSNATLFRHPPTHRSKHGTLQFQGFSSSQQFDKSAQEAFGGQTRSGVRYHRARMATVTDPGASYGVPCTPTPRLTGASIRPAHPANSMIGQKRRSGRSRLGRGPWVCGLLSDMWSGAARVSQGMAGRPCSIMAQPGGLRRPGFGPGWERFANPPPPCPSPRTRTPRRRMCQHGFSPSPPGPCQMIQSSASWSSALLKGQATHQSEQVLLRCKRRRQGGYG